MVGADQDGGTATHGRHRAASDCHTDGAERAGGSGQFRTAGRALGRARGAIMIATNDGGRGERNARDKC